jgi:hypothetical protein
MTANEMADELELKLDRSNSFGSPGYEDFELSSVLTEAQNLYVKKYYDEVNNRKGKGFEEIEIRNQGLGALIQDAPSLPPSASQVGVIINSNVTGKFFDLPQDHMYTIYEECVIDKKECGTQNTPIIAYIVDISHIEMQRFNWSKYKRPFYKNYGTARVWRTEYSRFTSGINPAVPATAKRHELFTDGTFNILTYHMRYLKNPQTITVDRNTPANQRNCILDYSTHTVIVDIAMSLMSDRVREQRLQNIEQFKELE